MGDNFPRLPEDQITWCNTHLPLWAATPTKFGLVAAQVTLLTTEVASATTALNTAMAARQASKNATTGFKKSAGIMSADARSLVNIIKSFIEHSGDETLWAAAGIEPPAAPGTAPAPTAPFQLSASVDTLGNVIVKWKASQPRGVSGVVYSIRRALDGGSYVGLDSVGEKTFTDETVPIGTQSISYTIQAKRGSQQSGWSDSLSLRFGRIGGGLSIISQSTQPVSMPVALAA